MCRLGILCLVSISFPSPGPPQMLALVDKLDLGSPIVSSLNNTLHIWVRDYIVEDKERKGLAKDK